jgi:phosphoribosyl 1,2-cyclic phosphate phosphodiesterase
MASAPIKVTILGSGTSMGVPSLACHCKVCTSADPHDNRLRPSILLSRGEQNVVIDTTPDFRQQALRAKIERLDAVMLTHGHADHILGFDDIRPYNIRQNSALPVYGNLETFDILRRAFAYVFDGRPVFSTVPSVTLHVVDGPFSLMGLEFVPVPLQHGDLEVLGYRFGRGAYLTDFGSLPDSSLALLEGLDVLVIDALRDVPHPMHQTVDQALALIERLKPRQAWFTHIAHDLPHAETNERLRKMGLKNVGLAYDGLQFEVRVDEEGRALSRSQTTAPGAVKAEPRKVRQFASPAEWAAHYAPSKRGSVLAIGNFDGLHLGHQAILRAVEQRAIETGCVATALTFDPTPRRVLKPEAAPSRLSTNAQRMDWFGMVGLEAAVVMPFTLDLARLSPEDFVDQILVRDLQVRAVLVGENFHFGHRQAGDVKMLRELGMRRGFDVVVIPPVTRRGEIVSSTSIRKAIGEGDVSYAARLLGRPFVLTGEVVKGAGVGRRFTFPTLNLVPEQEMLPAQGVYVTRTRIDGESKTRRSVTNIGIRPTFNGSGVTVETHLLNFSEEIAPKRIEVHFWKRLRTERKFNGPEELRAQIGKDIENADRFFATFRHLRSISAPAKQTRA